MGRHFFFFKKFVISLRHSGFKSRKSDPNLFYWLFNFKITCIFDSRLSQSIDH